MKYTGPKLAVELAMEHITDWDKEHAVGIFISADLEIKAVELLSIGTQTNVLVSPREFFRPAIRWASIAGILLHNHPINDLNPSAGDKDITKQLLKSGEILRLPLLDHIIFNRKRDFLSMKDAGLIKTKIIL
jgi:DNA repair protein RadC